MRKRTVATAALAALLLVSCGKGGGRGPAAPGAPALKIGPKDGAWSDRQALEGPMAVWGPSELGKEVLAVTCASAPTPAVVVSLFSAALPSGKPATGELTVRTDGKTTIAPLSPKDQGAEARLPVTPELVKALETARDLRFEVNASPGDGADTGAASQELRRVLTACH